MLDYIRGTLSRVGATEEEIVVDHQGIGFLISISARLIDTLPPQGEEVHIFVDLVANEREIRLYGFSTELSRSFFRLICRHVKNVGPATAMHILAGGTVEEMKQAILEGNPGVFSIAKGVGKKTAERIVHELKDSISGLDTGTPSAGPGSEEAGVRNDAVKTLAALGIPENIAAEKVHAALRETDKPFEVEDIVKKALKY